VKTKSPVFPCGNKEGGKKGDLKDIFTVNKDKYKLPDNSQTCLPTGRDMINMTKILYILSKKSARRARSSPFMI